MEARDRFEALKLKARVSAMKLQRLVTELDAHYQSHRYAPRTMRHKLDALRIADNKAWDKLFAFIQSISPRDWSCYVPIHWIRDHLTYEDAMTSGQLSVVPPPCYGSTPAQLQQFAWPIRESAK